MRGASPMPQGSPEVGPLSTRGREVLRLVSQGMSNQEIAAALVISDHTVHRHVANILTKLNQTSRTGAASYAIQTGCFDPPVTMRQQQTMGPSLICGLPRLRECVLPRV